MSPKAHNSVTALMGSLEPINYLPHNSDTIYILLSPAVFSCLGPYLRDPNG